MSGLVVARNAVRVGQRNGDKIKGLQVQRGPNADQLDPRVALLDWDASWPRLKWQVDKTIELGGNGVRFGYGLPGVVDGTYTRAYFHSKVRQFLDYCLSAGRAAGIRDGLAVSWMMWEYTPFSSEAVQTEFAHMGALLAKYPNVSDIDTINEWRFSITLSQAIASQTAAYATLKRVCPDIPVSLSFEFESTTGWTDYLADFARLVDHWNLHPYIGGNHPDPSQLGPFRASPYYKPWIIGECGSERADGPAFQRARWKALGKIMGEPDCAGGFGYTCLDVDTRDYALFTEARYPRPWMIEEFPAWPAARVPAARRGSLAFT